MRWHAGNGPAGGDHRQGSNTKYISLVILRRLEDHIDCGLEIDYCAAGAGREAACVFPRLFLDARRGEIPQLSCRIHQGQILWIRPSRLISVLEPTRAGQARATMTAAAREAKTNTKAGDKRGRDR